MKGVDDTIAAISTPPGEGAIAVVRISGQDALGVAGQIFRGGPLAHRVAVPGRIVDAAGRTVDEVVAVTFHAPKSYTGEDVAEISCHGGVLVAAEVLQVAVVAGARGAGPGEFTQRAFLNGKLDLTQAEAVMDLIRARTPRALRAAAAQLDGAIGDAAREIGEELLDAVAHIEAYIDFPEEDISPDAGEALLDRIGGARARIASLLATAEEGRILREGVRLTLCGRPNAGKSSLLNRLVGADRAIVSPVPGTTRDTIDELVSLRGIPFRVTDTAGLRETSDPVENEGVQRARKAAEEADLVVRVIDATDPEPAGDPSAGDGEIVVWNKIDLPSASPAPPAAVAISCATGEGIERLVGRLVTEAGLAAPGGRESLAAINARHQACFQRADEALGRAERAMRDGVEPEFVAVDLRLALEAAGEVVGRVGTEDILGRIFGTFCIGK